MSVSLFLPRNLFFNAVVAAGAGIVVQQTYTVPAGKIAELRYGAIRCTANTGAANLIELIVDVIPSYAVNSNRIVNLLPAGSAVHLFANHSTVIDLIAGDQVRLVTINTSAVAVTPLMCAFIREYQ